MWFILVGNNKLSLKKERSEQLHFLAVFSVISHNLTPLHLRAYFETLIGSANRYSLPCLEISSHYLTSNIQFLSKNLEKKAIFDDFFTTFSYISARFLAISYPYLT